MGRIRGGTIAGPTTTRAAVSSHETRYLNQGTFAEVEICSHPPTAWSVERGRSKLSARPVHGTSVRLQWTGQTRPRVRDFNIERATGAGSDDM